MRIGFVFLCATFTVFAQASLREHLELLLPHAESCANRVLNYGLGISPQTQDIFAPKHAVATQILIDSTHLNRTFFAARQIRELLVHSNNGASIRRTRIDVRKNIRSSWNTYVSTYGATYCDDFYGNHVLQILENDDDQATKTRVELEKLEEVFEALSYNLYYLKSWRLHALDRGANPNTAMPRRSAISAVKARKMLEAMKSTDLAVSSIGGLFKAPRGPVGWPMGAIPSWFFPAEKLPAVAARALEYILANEAYYELRDSQVFNATLVQLSRRLQAL